MKKIALLLLYGSCICVAQDSATIIKKMATYAGVGLSGYLLYSSIGEKKTLQLPSLNIPIPIINDISLSAPLAAGILGATYYFYPKEIKSPLYFFTGIAGLCLSGKLLKQTLKQSPDLGSSTQRALQQSAQLGVPQETIDDFSNNINSHIHKIKNTKKVDFAVGCTAGAVGLWALGVWSTGNINKLQH